MSTNRQLIKIEPSILIWARESLGLSIDDVALRLDKDKEVINQWEKGNTIPSLAQLENLAYNIYKRPLAVFFLPTVPKESTPKQDFRTISDKEVSKLSPELRLFIRKAKYHQHVLKLIFDEVNPIKRPLHKSIKLSDSSDPISSAESLRQYLGITKQLQENWKNSAAGFAYYRDIIEKNGVYVFQYPLHEVRGFSLMDKEFPIIVINSGDTPNGKIFSLIHELCHILFNTGGVFRDFYTEELRQNPNKIEIFCNKFASNFLLPTYELIDENQVIQNGNNKKWSDYSIQKIANTFKISKEVVLRRLLDIGKTTPSFYNQTTARWKEEYNKLKDEKKKNQEGGPSYHVTNISHLGKNFISQILINLHNGKLTPTQVSDFLNVKINKIGEYERKVF